MNQRSSQQYNPMNSMNLVRSGSAQYNQPNGQSYGQQNPFVNQQSTNNGPQFLFDNISADKFSFNPQKPPSYQSNYTKQQQNLPYQQQQFTFTTQSNSNSSQKPTQLSSTPQRNFVNSYVQQPQEQLKFDKPVDESESSVESQDENELQDQDQVEDEEDNEEDDDEEDEEDDDDEDDQEVIEQDENELKQVEEPIQDVQHKALQMNVKFAKENKQNLIRLKENDENKNYKSLAQISKIMAEVTNVNKELDSLEQVIGNSLLESRIKFNQEFSQNMSLSECQQDENQDQPDFDRSSIFSYTKYLQEFKQFQDFQQHQNDQPIGNKFTNIFNESNDNHQSQKKDTPVASGTKQRQKSKIQVKNGKN